MPLGEPVQEITIREEGKRPAENTKSLSSKPLREKRFKLKG